jgi:hypothetical protein|tara:strand:- start:29 stop:307 length:279 start_codon:yes stop_codon:yes gene_type:complete
VGEPAAKNGVKRSALQNVDAAGHFTKPLPKKALEESLTLAAVVASSTVARAVSVSTDTASGHATQLAPLSSEMESVGLSVVPLHLYWKQRAT